MAVRNMTRAADPGGRVSVTLRVYEILRREILSLELRPGQRLDEVSLSNRFRCSRTPVREALVKLDSESLVTTLPNGRAMVASIEFGAVPAYFDALTLLQRVTTRLAARFRTESDLVEINRCGAEFQTAQERGNVPDMIETNRDFHIAIANAGRNAYYHAFYARLLDEGRRLLRLYFFTYDDERPPVYSNEHDLIIDAISARDEDLADRLARQHATQVADGIRSYLDDRPGAAISLEEAVSSNQRAVTA